jgi:hypothetical protein
MGKTLDGGEYIVAFVECPNLDTGDDGEFRESEKSTH